MQQQPNKDLIDCINSKVKSKKDYIREINEFFADLKSSEKAWKVPFVFGDFYQINIMKNNIERNLYGKVIDYNVYFYCHAYTESKPCPDGYRPDRILFVDDLNPDTLREIVSRLPDILIEIGKQEGCIYNEKHTPSS